MSPIIKRRLVTQANVILMALAIDFTLLKEVFSAHILKVKIENAEYLLPKDLSECYNSQRLSEMNLNTRLNTGKTDLCS